MKKWAKGGQTLVDLPPSTERSVMNEEPNADASRAVQHGRDHEEQARSDYEIAQEVTVERAGFCLTQAGAVGATPDGLLPNGGLLEIKCPYAAQDMTVVEGVRSGKISFLREDENNELVLPTEHQYMYQVCKT